VPKELYIMVSKKNRGNNGFAAPPQTEKELKTLLRSMVREVTAMTPKQRLASLVSAGIFTKSGKFSKKYGG
jgi:hypothetical protein